MSKVRNPSTGLKLKLPEFSNTHSALWVPVYLEPITFSGERITIGLVFRDINGTIKVINTLPQDTLNKVFGAKGNELYSLSNLVLKNFDTHMQLTRKFENFVPTVKGVYVGEPIETFDKDLESIIFQARKNYSIFSALFVNKEISTTNTKNKSDENQTNKWVHKIKEEIYKSAPLLINNFNKKINLRKDAKTTTIGYIGNKLAFNFGFLDPDSSAFSSQQNRIIRKATELNSINKIYSSNLQHLEVNILVPSTKEISQISQQRLLSATEELKQLGDDINIHIELGSSIEKITNRMIADGNLQ